MRRTEPISACYGVERGTPVDRYYLHRFLDNHRARITGRVIEIQGTSYIDRFGVEVSEAHSVDIVSGTSPTFVCDLAESEGVLPSNHYDCFLMPNSTQHFRKLKACLKQALRVVRPGGWILGSSAVLLPLIPDGPEFWHVTPDDSEAGGHGGSNGLSLDLEGRLILCEHGNRQVSRIETDNSRSVLADRFEGKRLNSPNDILFHSSGWAYFTDPPYGLTDGDEDPQKELDHNGIYRLGPEGQLELLREQTRPNGLALSPDEETLYVANSDSEQRVWFAYDVLEDGRLSEGKIFFDATESDAPGVPDGLRVDTSGNVYATGPGGVWIFAPDGTHLGTIHPPELPANVGWGDEDGKTLYITARTGLYRIRLLVAGKLP